jgi:hypothetical protein
MRTTIVLLSLVLMVSALFLPRSHLTIDLTSLTENYETLQANTARLLHAIASLEDQILHHNRAHSHGESKATPDLTNPTEHDSRIRAVALELRSLTSYMENIHRGQEEIDIYLGKLRSDRAALDKWMDGPSSEPTASRPSVLARDIQEDTANVPAVRNNGSLSALRPFRRSYHDENAPTTVCLSSETSMFAFVYASSQSKGQDLRSETASAYAAVSHLSPFTLISTNAATSSSSLPLLPSLSTNTASVPQSSPPFPLASINTASSSLDGELQSTTKSTFAVSTSSSLPLFPLANTNAASHALSVGSIGYTVIAMLCVCWIIGG